MENFLASGKTQGIVKYDFATHPVNLYDEIKSIHTDMQCNIYSEISRCSVWLKNHATHVSQTCLQAPLTRSLAFGETQKVPGRP
jgi:hypothetical protein